MNRNQNQLIARLPDALLPWYEKNARKLPWRETKHPYAVWLSEIMLQQTRVEAVKQYYARFLETYPTIEALAQANEATLMKLWEGLGYYSRARNLQKAASVIMEQFGGVFPTQYDAILSLPGIGAYTAGAISSICFGLPTPAVDGNVLRVVSRICEIDETLTSAPFKKDVHEALLAVYPKEAPGDFTQALMELGATVCLPNGAPLCDCCPASEFCRSNLHGTQKKYPPKAEKKPRRKEYLTVFLLQCGEYFAVNKRPASGLLRGLWEFPNTKGLLCKEDAAAYLEQKGVKPKDILLSVLRNHIFTHVEWTMNGYLFTCDAMPECFTWVTGEQLFNEIALPTAFKQFAELLP
ncbi:MAG: A/G-specific adenine glycosylase [Clostridia bacterium]|nr:A/G-specific adenine glycosylase [Clostridia bacterium]